MLFRIKGLCFILVLISTNYVLSKKKKEQVAVKEDLPYIACDVCENVIEELFLHISDARENAPYKKLEEIKVLEVMDAICKNDEKYGEWIRQIDIKEKKVSKSKSTLMLEKPGGFSKCEQECSTISQSCQNLLDEEVDKDDLSALLWKGKASLEEVKTKVCQKWTKRCPNKKYLPESYKRKDYPFKVASTKDIEMEQLMASMKAAGMGGMSMYNKDDMEDMMSGGGLGGEDMEDEYGDMDSGAMGALGGEGAAARPDPVNDYEF